MLVSDLCTRALGLAGVQGVGSNPSSEDMSTAVKALGDMLQSWALEGMDVGVYADLASTDTLYIDGAFLKAVRYALAVELAAEFGTQIDERITPIAIDEMGKVRAALTDIDLMRCDTSIVGPGRIFDHTTGQ